MIAAPERRPERHTDERGRPTVAVRLHDEVLPPRLETSSAHVIRNARRGLILLAVGVVSLQLVSALVGHRLNAVARSGTDAYSIWQGYVSGPVPDVLVIGNSLAQADIDEVRLSSELAKSAGRPVTVKKMGFNGQGPLFYDALMYRIMKLPEHPKLVVVSTMAVDLSPDGCAQCRALLTSDLWDIGDLTDPGFVQLAIHVDPDPGLLVAGWALPSLANYPSIVALQCLAVNYGRATTKSVLGSVPSLLKQPNVCETQPGYLLLAGWANQPAMTPYDMQRSTQSYRSLMAGYQIAPRAVASLRDAISRGQAGGATVVLLQAPLHFQSRSLFPEHETAYGHQMRLLANDRNVHLVDLSDSVPDDPMFWVDTQHLDHAGAAYLAPRLAMELAPILAGCPESAAGRECA